MDDDPIEAKCSNESCRNAKDNLKMLIMTTKKQVNDLQAYQSISTEVDILRVKLAATEALAQNATEKAIDAVNKKEIAEAELKQLQSATEFHKKKLLMLQEKADDAEKHEQQANHWRDKYDMICSLTEKLEGNNIEVKAKYESAVQLAKTLGKQLKTAQTQASNLKITSSDYTEKEKRLNKYLKSAIQLIDALSVTSNLSKQPKNINDLVQLFRRDDIRLYFNSQPWKNSARDEQPSTSDAPMPESPESEPHDALLGGRTLSDDEEEEEDDPDIRNLEKMLTETVVKLTAKDDAREPLEARPDFVTKMRELNARKKAPRIVESKNVKKWPEGIRKPAASKIGLCHPQKVHAVSFPTTDFDAIAMASERRKKALLGASDPEAGTSGATTIHGRKGKTVREQQSEMMKGESVKEKVARMKAEKPSLPALPKVPIVQKSPKKTPQIVRHKSYCISEKSDSEDEIQLDEVEAPKTRVRTRSSSALPPAVRSSEAVQKSPKPPPLTPRRSTRLNSRPASRATSPVHQPPQNLISQAIERKSHARRSRARGDMSESDSDDEFKLSKVQPAIPTTRVRTRSSSALPPPPLTSRRSTKVGSRQASRASSPVAKKPQNREDDDSDEKSDSDEEFQLNKSKLGISTTRARTRSISVSRSSEAVQKAPMPPPLTPRRSTRLSSSRVSSPVLQPPQNRAQRRSSVRSETPRRKSRSEKDDEGSEEEMELMPRKKEDERSVGEVLGVRKRQSMRKPAKRAAPRPLDAGPPVRVKGMMGVSAPRKKEKPVEQEAVVPEPEAPVPVAAVAAKSVVEEVEDAEEPPKRISHQVPLSTKITPDFSVLVDRENATSTPDTSKVTSNDLFGDLNLSDSLDSSRQESDLEKVITEGQADVSEDDGLQMDETIGEEPAASVEKAPEADEKSAETTEDPVAASVEKAPDADEERAETTESPVAKRLEKAPNPVQEESIIDEPAKLADSPREVKPPSEVPKPSLADLCAPPPMSTRALNTPKSPKQMLASQLGLDISDSEDEVEDAEPEKIPEVQELVSPPPLTLDTDSDDDQLRIDDPAEETSVPSTSKPVEPVKMSEDVPVSKDLPPKIILPPERKMEIPKPRVPIFKKPAPSIPKPSIPTSSNIDDDLSLDILAGARMLKPPVKKPPAVKRTVSETAQEPSAKRAKLPEAPPVVKRTKAVAPEIVKSAPVAEETISDAPSTSGKKTAILIEPRRRGRPQKTEKVNAEPTQKKSTKAKSIARGYLRQALDLKVAVQELKRPLEEKGIVLEGSIPLHPAEAADVMMEFLRETSAGDMWAVMLKQRADMILTPLMNSEEQNFLQVSVTLNDDDKLLIDLFAGRILAELCCRETLDARQCGRYTRLFCHAVRFSEKDDEEKEELMRRFVLILLNKHEHQLMKAIAYCLISDVSEHCRWLATEIEEGSSTFSTAFRILMHLDSEQARVVSWLLKSKLECNTITPPTADEIKKEFSEEHRKFLAVEEVTFESLKPSIYLAKTGIPEVLEVTFSLLKHEMTRLEKQLLEPHEKEQELKHKTVFTVPTVYAKLTVEETRVLKREFEWQKCMLMVMIDNPNSNNWKAIMAALREISPKIVAIRELLESPESEQFAEPPAIPPLRDAVDQICQLISEFTNFPLKPATLPISHDTSV